MVSALWNDRTRSICGGVALAAGGIGYMVSGIIASTAIRTAVAFAKYCPNHGEPVETPFGIMTCRPLGILVEQQQVALPALSWVAPVLLGVGSLLLTYNYVTAGGISTCCRRRAFVDINQLGSPPAYDHDKMFDD